jgi:tetratricopeptide (TPR) repeat protein
MTSANELKEQGVVLFNQHDYESAARQFQQARDLFEAENDADMVAEMDVNIGLVHRSLGENQQALEYMEKGLEHFQKQEDAFRTAQVLGNLGGVYAAINDTERAHDAYRQAADTFRNLEEKELYSQTLIALGRLQFGSGKWLEGATTYRIGLEALDNLTFPQRIIKFLSGIISRLGGA